MPYPHQDDVEPSDAPLITASAAGQLEAFDRLMQRDEPWSAGCRSPAPATGGAAVDFLAEDLERLTAFREECRDTRENTTPSFEYYNHASKLALGPMADTSRETDLKRAGGIPTPVPLPSDQRAAETCVKTEGANLDVEVHTPHAHKTGHHWIDMTVAVAAVFISVVSLAVAILHGRTMERMAEENARLVAANSWPFMGYGAGTVTTDGVTKVRMQVFNSGVGPAKIESAELMWKGVAYRDNREFLEACCGFDPASRTLVDSDVFAGYVLRAGNAVRFLEFSKSADPAVFAALQQAVLSRDLQLNICYCSIFDECWQTDLTTLSLKPRQVEACTLPKVPFDQGISNRKQ